MVFINIFFCAHVFIDSVNTTFTEIMHRDAMATATFCTDTHPKSTCLNNLIHAHLSLLDFDSRYKNSNNDFFSPTRTPVISVSGDVNNMIVESAEAEHV